MKLKSFVIFLSMFVLVFSALVSPAPLLAQTPKISVSPMYVNLGKLKIGGTSEKVITIKNTGTSDLTISGISITGLDATEFSQTNGCTPIPAGGSCTMTATFTPALPFGPKSAILSISSNDLTKPTVNVKILGTASPPKISVRPFSVNLGTVLVDSTSLSKTVTVVNTGVSDLDITDISITGLNASEFDQTNDCTTPIPAGGFCTVTGTFGPTSMGSKTAVLGISSNDPKKPIANVKLLGKAPPRLFQIAVTQPAGGGKITLKGRTTAITSALVKENTNASFTMKPDPGYRLSAVMIDGNLIFDGTTITDPNLTPTSTSKNYEYVFKLVTGPHTLAADFAEDGQGNLMLTGSLGSGYTTVAGGTGSLRSGSAGAVYGQAIDKYVDKIVAIQSDGGYLAAYSMENSRSATINPDGTFSISLDTSRDWLLVLVDSTAPVKSDQFVGYVALNAGTENLLQVPASTSTISSLDLGTITASGDTGQSETPIDESDFSLTSTQLLNLAKNDDAFKSVKNFVINYNNETGVFYTLRPDFRWRGTYASINGAFQNPSGYTYSNYAFQLDSNTTTINIDKICGTNGQTQVIVKLAPPSDVTTSDARTFNPGNPMSSANVKWKTATDGFIEVYQDPGNSDFFATNRYGDVSQSYAAPLTGTIPGGNWLYYEGDQLRGQFDVAVASPLRVDNTIKGFVPSARINIDGDGKITSVDIKWYYWDDSTTEYVELTDITVLRYLIGTGGVYFDNSSSGTRTYETVNFDPAAQTFVAPSGTWYYGTAGPANQQLEGFGIFYSSGGIGFFIEFFR